MDGGGAGDGYAMSNALGVVEVNARVTGEGLFAEVEDFLERQSWKEGRWSRSLNGLVMLFSF